MQLTKVGLHGFRGLDCEVPIGTPISLLAGPNNSGKTTTIDAIRSVTFGFNEQRPGRYISPNDFPHDANGRRIANELSIELFFDRLTLGDKGRMLTRLTPNESPDTAKIGIRATISDTEQVYTQFFGGDLANADVELFARSAVRHVYLPPLRDAARDLRPGRSSRLRDLVIAFSALDGGDDKKVESIMQAANHQLRGVEAVNKAAHAMSSQLDSLTGVGPYQQKTDLNFSDPSYFKILSTLQAKIGADTPLDLDENGLGFNNLLYMSVLLSVLENTGDDLLNLLLIEEPEAHLHPQLQALLMDHIERASNSELQVALTTHSPQLASGATIDQITVLGRDRSTMKPAHLKEAPLDVRQRNYLRRFLDVTKSSLLFSRGVILVEGIAEQLLIPEIAKRSKHELNARGITVVNVSGLGFANFTPLFGEGGLEIPCAILTDRDPESTDGLELDGDTEDSQNEDVDGSATPGIAETSTASSDRECTSTPSGSAASISIAQLATDNVHVFIGEKTLEWDIAATESGANRPTLIESLKPVRRNTALRLDRSTLKGNDWADDFLKSIERHKGPFAQSLATTLSAEDKHFSVPAYIKDAIRWVCEASALSVDTGQDPSSDDGRSNP